MQPMNWSNVFVVDQTDGKEYFLNRSAPSAQMIVDNYKKCSKTNN
jgi:hypothetical protein